VSDAAGEKEEKKKRRRRKDGLGVNGGSHVKKRKKRE
jgi:hypothetical protein